MFSSRHLRRKQSENEKEQVTANKIFELVMASLVTSKPVSKKC